MATSKTLNGPTPNGGVRAEAIFLNDDHENVDEKEATATEIIEYNEQGDIIFRTYGTYDPPKE